MTNPVRSVASTARPRAYAASRPAAAHEGVERQRQPGDDPGGEEQEPGQVRVGGAAEAAARAAGDTADGEAGEERGTDGQHDAEDDERRGEGCGDGPRVHRATLSEV